MSKKEAAIRIGNIIHVVAPLTIEGELGESHWLKSCPSCSQRLGFILFKLYPEDFGESEVRGGKHSGAQSYCIECRSKK